MEQQFTILIVEDNPDIRTLLDVYLSSAHTTLLAEDGVIAWSIIQEHGDEIDIVISDIQMPNMDGVALLEKIRASYPKLCVIMTSGTSDIQTAIQALRLGAYDYVCKPFQGMDEIQILIQRWSEHQSLEAKLEQYAALHKDILQSMKVRTFMAVDVVGSRSIKSGEDPLLIHYSFLAYHRFIEAIVLENGGQVHSTAGDGAMTCFILPQSAITAATQIMSGIGGFNSKQNRLSSDFTLRIGIHTGTVILEESGRVNEMYSESIDITGHLQKDAEGNQVAVSESTLEGIEDRSPFMALEKEVDGFPIYEMQLTGT